MHKRLTRAFLHISWHTLFVIVVVLSVALSLLWITQSSIDELRPKVVEWINAETEYPLQVEKMSIQWEGIVPHLKFSEISILDDEKKPLAQFKSAAFNLDLIESAKRMKLVTGQTTISGIEINLIHQDGKIDLLGSPSKGVSDNNEFSYWLLEQQHLKIVDSRLIWHEEATSLAKHSPFILSDVMLDLTNQDELHQVSGSAKSENLSGKVSFKISLSGDPFSKDWNGEMSFTGQQLQLAHLIEDEIISDLPTRLRNVSSDEETQFNVDINSHWKQSNLISFGGQVSLENSVSDSISRITSNLHAERDEQGAWDINLPSMMIHDAGKTMSLTSAHVNLAQNFTLQSPTLTARISELDIETLIAFLPDKFNQKLAPAQAEGKLKNINLSYADSQQTQKMSASGNFSSLKFTPRTGTAILTNLSGVFKATQDSLDLKFRGQDVEVIQDIIIEQNIVEKKTYVLDNLLGSLNWEQKEQDWLLTIPEFKIADQALDFQLNGTVKSLGDQAPEFDLQGKFLKANIADISSMIPDFLIPPATREWLDMAILDGHLTGGGLIIKGPMDKFPFDGDEGQFEISLGITDAKLNYSEGWPMIENIDAELLIDGRTLTIDSPKGSIFDASLPETVVTIPDLGVENRHLLIKGKALHDDLSEGIKFINNSPLKSTVGEKLQYLSLSGDLDLDLDIDIPLYGDQDNSKVDGELHLNNNQLSLEELDLHLKKVTGDFIFNQDRWGGKDLKAKLLGQTIDIKIDIQDDGDNNNAEPVSGISFSSNADKKFIKERLIDLGVQEDKLSFLDLLKGTTTWEAQLFLPPNPGDPNEKTGITISSSLQGLTIDAPTPIGKSSDQQKPLTISTSLSKQPTKNISFEYNNLIKGEILLDSSAQETEFSHVAFHFGPGPVTQPKMENNIIWIDGHIPSLDINAWLNFIDQEFGSTAPATFSPAENNAAMNISIDRLSMAGQNFKDNHIQIDSGLTAWEVNIKNNDIEGTMNYPYNLVEQAVTGKFKRLKLSSPSLDKESMELDPTRLPNLTIKADSFELDKLKLGQLQLQMSRTKNGSQIENLKLSSPEFQLYASGKWTKQAGGNPNNLRTKSKFLVQADGPALGPLLEKFDYGVTGIEGGETKIIIDSSWPGSPADFELAKATAKMSIEVKDGRFTEIKNRIGKVFGLLSIQSISRRLSLDFNDLFKKGFTFDKIYGDFDIDRGNAYTNNLSMTGPSAQIDVTGRIGLSKEDYDQLVTVIPSVADSLPVASALFGPIGAGVGAAILLAGKVFTKIPETIDKVLKIQYTLTGSWDEPVLTRLGKNNKNENIKAPGHKQK